MQKPFLCLLILLLSVGYGHSQSSSIRKVLFIGVDGCRADVLAPANTPAIDALMAQSIYSTDGLCAYKTWSGNGWSSMLTGTWHTKHGVTDNTFSGADYGNFPDFISRLETFNPDLRTVSVVHWGPINSTIIQNADDEQTYATDLAVKNGAVAALSNDDPDLLFVAFDDVDHAGHGYGFSSTIPEYVQSIETTDAYIGEIVAAMKNRPNFAQEDWLVVVTTDHGGNLAGHGGGTLEERTIFTIYSNPAFTPRQLTREPISQTNTFQEAHFAEGTYAVPTDQSPFLFGDAQDFTLELWVKPNAFTEDPSFISNKDWDSGLYPGFVLSAQQGQYWKVNIGDGVDRLDIQGGHMTPGEWHHLAVSFDRDGLMTAYEDGIVVGFDKMQKINNIDSGLPLVINQDGTTNYGLNLEGSYKDIRIWNAVLPDSVILQWATRSVDATHPFYNALLANWKCEDGAGANLLDASSNHNEAAITGPITWIPDQTASFSVYDYAATTREPDNAVTVLNWMCVPIDSSWTLDGKAWAPDCSPLVSGTDELKENGVSIFPNPAFETVNVVFAQPLANNTRAILLDYSGRQVQTYNIPAQQNTLTIPTRGLAKGIYLLQLEGSDYRKTFKVVVE